MAIVEINTDYNPNVTHVTGYQIPTLQIVSLTRTLAIGYETQA